jgi:hypothetical protein
MQFQPIFWLRTASPTVSARHPLAGYEGRANYSVLQLEPVPPPKTAIMVVIASGGTNWTAKMAASGAFEVLVKSQKMSLTPLFCLRKCCRTGNRIGPRDKVLNQPLQSLIQNLQKLNQKVK